MSQHQRQIQMVGGNLGGHFNDTTYTKIFVGGLAWETQRDTMNDYFEQFGEILEAVIITDKNTGRSKGYGFVTFKDPEAAFRACQNPSPVIDGRRANCNLAALGAQKTKPPTPQQGTSRIRPPLGLVAQPAYPGSSSSSTYFRQPSAQLPFPYSAYGYGGYSRDTIYPMNYYGVYGGQQFSPYYTAGAGGSVGPGYFHSALTYYSPYAQSSQAHGYGAQHPQMVQFPFYPQHQFNSPSILSPPTMALQTTATTTTTTSGIAGTAGVAGSGSGSGPSQSPEAFSEQDSST
ncbi:hypothetical protein Nepgr_024361 [Nepenthes gracilis]|uniref:RRM domain-containing protein n=1 Tax=Nepenthes gracilis TaxID=150966 RepID=A0AAD3T2P4_NEPGR|nr:hypothetical protein Nepgr_024361 [Nepenthes gracilis]